MSADEARLREVLAEVEAAGAALRRRAPDELAEALGEAWSHIADPERALGRRAREELPARTGLTLPMVAWSLATTFEHLPEALREAARRVTPPAGCRAAPHRLGALVLAGNVFTAPVAPLSLALLTRTPLLVKASSQDDALPRLFAEALDQVDAGLAAACRVVTFGRDERPLVRSVLSRAAVIVAYGSDRTLQALRAEATPGAAFVGRGHGLGLGFASVDALRADVEEVARRFALDVAAYDQRGCMSPHVVLVESGGVGAVRFAEHLADALDALHDTLPRGALPAAVGTAQIQWRGVAAAQGRLYERRASAVAVAPRGAALRPSPGWRNVTVAEVDGLADLGRRADRLGAHLKTLGVAGDAERAAKALPPSTAPRVCAAGQMQRPGLLSRVDGRAPWEGLLRHVEVEPRTARTLEPRRSEKAGEDEV